MLLELLSKYWSSEGKYVLVVFNQAKFRMILGTYRALRWCCVEQLHGLVNLGSGTATAGRVFALQFVVL